MTKCARCGRDHTNDKPFNIKDAENNASNALAKEIDQEIINSIKRGADINAGDGGYQIGTEEGYKEFAKRRTIIGYDDNEPIYEPERGRVYTRAFIFCKECGEPISAHGGPRYNAVCVKCKV